MHWSICIGYFFGLPFFHRCFSSILFHSFHVCLLCSFAYNRLHVCFGDSYLEFDCTNRRFPHIIINQKFVAQHNSGEHFSFLTTTHTCKNSIRAHHNTNTYTHIPLLRILFGCAPSCLFRFVQHSRELVKSNNFSFTCEGNECKYKSWSTIACTVNIYLHYFIKNLVFFLLSFFFFWNNNKYLFKWAIIRGDKEIKSVIVSKNSVFWEIIQLFGLKFWFRRQSFTSIYISCVQVRAHYVRSLSIPCSRNVI